MTIEVTDDTLAALTELAQRYAEVDGGRDGATTHGRIADAGELLSMLAEDAAMAVRRPGSWERSGIVQHLAAHGYEV